MSDEGILVAGTAPAPADYVVPNLQQIALKTAFALFDGTSAVGSFRPTLELLTDAGLTLAEIAIDDTIAAGVSAACSWFPGGGLIAAATALNLPWGYAISPITNLASGNALTQIDFNTANPNNIGYTSGDPDITFGLTGSGRWSISLNTTGMYLQFSSATFQTTAAPAAATVGWLNSQWLSGSRLGAQTVANFAKTPGFNVWIAQGTAISIYNADGAHQPLPKTGNTAVAQNSGQLASGNVAIFAVKLSNVSVAQNE